MKFLVKRYYDLVLGLVTLAIPGLLIIYLILAMMSVTSGVSRAIAPGHEPQDTATFRLDRAVALDLVN